MRRREIHVELTGSDAFTSTDERRVGGCAEPNVGARGTDGNTYTMIRARRFKAKATIKCQCRNQLLDSPNHYTPYQSRL